MKVDPSVTWNNDIHKLPTNNGVALTRTQGQLAVTKPSISTTSVQTSYRIPLTPAGPQVQGPKIVSTCGMESVLQQTATSPAKFHARARFAVRSSLCDSLLAHPPLVKRDYYHWGQPPSTVSTHAIWAVAALGTHYLTLYKLVRLVIGHKRTIKGLLPAANHFRDTTFRPCPSELWQRKSWQTCGACTCANLQNVR